MNNSELINKIRKFVIKEARGVKTISKDLGKVVDTMKAEVQTYLKYKIKTLKKLRNLSRNYLN